MQDIFISYRRDDASDVTGRIADVLRSKFGANLVFKDVDSIPLGTDFRHAISEAVGRCDVLLAVIGDDWLQATNEPAPGGSMILMTLSISRSGRHSSATSPSFRCSSRGQKWHAIRTYPSDCNR